MKAPFTLLTGFLGAGKTTTLNRLLAGVATSGSGRRVAVLVNELGRVSIDSQLIVGASGDVIELTGGCLCCALDLRSDLWEGIVDIIERAKPDHVVLETTGIAEPPAILGGLDHFKVRSWVEPAGVVCVVDGSVGAATLDHRAEARSQVESADRVLVSKLDIAEPAAVTIAHERIVELNPSAERASFPATTEGGVALAHWILEGRAQRAPAAAKPHDHAHRQIFAASFLFDEPLAREPLVALLAELAPDLLRVKGFVDIAGDDRRGFLELASGRAKLSFGDRWPADVPRTSQLVFIGEGLGEAAIRRRLWACHAAG